MAFWSNPTITAGAGSDAKTRDDDLTPAELDARREHLRTLGYIQ